MSTGTTDLSATNGDAKPANADAAEQPAAPQSNFERLISHLAEDSLAAQLVSAYAAPGGATPADAVAKITADRLEQLKRSYDKPENQQD